VQGEIHEEEAAIVRSARLLDTGWMLFVSLMIHYFILKGYDVYMYVSFPDIGSGRR
jgi:hypothetical protein